MLPFNTVSKLINDHGLSMEVVDRKFKSLREARILGVTALVIASTGKEFNPTFIQSSDRDPPDGYVGRESKSSFGTFEILKVEITSYFDGTGETLLEQLKRTKKLTNPPVLSSEYVLVVDLRAVAKPDLEACLDYIKEINNPFPVFVIKRVTQHPDTVAEVSIIDPNLDAVFIKKVNVGYMATLYNKHKAPISFEKKRAGSVKKVRYNPSSNKIPKPRWESETERLLGGIK